MADAATSNNAVSTVARFRLPCFSSMRPFYRATKNPGQTSRGRFVSDGSLAPQPFNQPPDVDGSLLLPPMLADFIVEPLERPQ